MSTLTIVLIAIGIALVAACALCFIFYRVADVDKALIITGGKEPKVIVSGVQSYLPLSVRFLTSLLV